MEHLLRGVLLIWDRTPKYIFLPGSPEHMRGWFFDLFLQLASFERERYPFYATIKVALMAVGFELRPQTTIILGDAP
ncbi:hypothetical protein BG74_06940 [Sodalis-like endosymbiont of Proechinophthirus fluctus]|uniref:hypothetical protein n=1 Tax=Sodalis-like endosymbiont of Proechinophthirus fluctus TaxID=1462730 RepID=UPI0007A7DF0D|nr:hypothetical protein [Sodalis-like endosymbiont of Proechinophthirus fluctus]KYP96695.1 hypothetical protein BG74_06940 [Sodalis-like endosymbiont of Proechinophthirus fluctus]